MNSGDGVTVNCGCCDHDTGINHEEGTNLGQIKSSNRDVVIATRAIAKVGLL